MSDNEQYTAADRAHTEKELFPIREVARLTGVNPVTLRAWERRYGLIQPTRTESGHRLYSLTDVAEVRAILGWLERGVAVSKVGTLIARNPAPVDPSPIAYHKGDSDCRHWRDRITGAVQGFNEATLARLYGEVFSTYPMATAFNEVFLPVWERARLHQDAFGQASEWAFLDAFLRGQALKRLQFAPQENAEHHVLLCGIHGQYHELELLVAALLLGGEHVRVQPLGTGQPLEELGLVSERIQPHAVILFSNHAPAADAGRRFMKLGLKLSCPLLLAGEMSELIHDQLVHSPIACLGGNSQLMQRRLLQYIAGHLDT